ncbi:MAG: S1/P1 nuclease [Ignavibacterium sp.]|nr:MAG: S1/P1 nuclease [Ignavibacterium sp.]
MKQFLLILFLFIITTNSQLMYAWNYSSHALTGIITYKLMDTNSRNKVLELITHHPRYKEDFVDAMPDTSKYWDQTQKERWIFAQISFWPDIARGFDGETREKYHHGTWHYINLGVFPNEELKKQFGSTLPSNTKLNYDENSEFERMNIMEALDYITNEFESKEATKEEKAVLLCWLFHLVCDIHQPLHTSAMFTPRLFSEGDRGGNSIRVGNYNLHSTWDWALGGEKDLIKLAEFLTEIRKDYISIFDDSGTNRIFNFSAWLKESYSLAKSEAYSKAVRDTVLSAENSNSCEFPSFTMSDEYKLNMEEAAKERVIIAGYRLSELLGVLL